MEMTSDSGCVDIGGINPSCAADEWDADADIDLNAALFRQDLIDINSWNYEPGTDKGKSH
jgi:hypothetical protein